MQKALRGHNAGRRNLSKSALSVLKKEKDTQQEKYKTRWYRRT